MPHRIKALFVAILPLLVDLFSKQNICISAGKNKKKSSRWKKGKSNSLFVHVGSEGVAVSSNSPSQVPSNRPSSSSMPSDIPSTLPTMTPSTDPTNIPTSTPSMFPSASPFEISGGLFGQVGSEGVALSSAQPSNSQSGSIASDIPSTLPTTTPSSSRSPSKSPSSVPSGITSTSPSTTPSGMSSKNPSLKPSDNPSTSPSMTPSMKPSKSSSQHPSPPPKSLNPTSSPSESTYPSLKPSPQPSINPTSSLRPSCSPTNVPSISTMPSRFPSNKPSISPSSKPSRIPSKSPSAQPSRSVLPSSNPSSMPSSAPSKEPITKDDICPLDRVFHTPKAFLEPKNYTGTETPLLNEISALAISSQRIPGAPDNVIAWVASDGPQSAVSAVDLNTGKTVAVVYLDNILLSEESDDWEAIALGPCNRDSIVGVDRDCLYIGNVGNNGASDCKNQSCTLGREELFIYKMKEPTLTSLNMGDIYRTVATLPFRFDSSFPVNQYNFEALFIDWTGSGDSTEDNPGDLYLIPKQSDNDLVRVAKIPESIIGPLDGSTGFADTFYCEAIDAPSWDSRSISGAEMTRDGRLIALRDTTQIRYFARETGQTVSKALKKGMCKYISRTSKNEMEDEDRFESISFVPSFSGSFETDLLSRTAVEVSECFKKRICNVPIYKFNITTAAAFDGSDPSAFSLSSSMVPSTAEQWTVITYDDAEGGWGNFEQGASVGETDDSVLLETGLFGNGISLSYRLRDNEGRNSSVVHAQDHDITMYNKVRVSFNFVMDGYDSNENFYLEYSSDGGKTFSIIKEYITQTNGRHLPNAYDEGEPYHDSVTIGSDQVSFSENARLRFRSNASKDNDRVYIDNILFEGS